MLLSTQYISGLNNRLLIARAGHSWPALQIFICSVVHIIMAAQADSCSGSSTKRSLHWVCICRWLFISCRTLFNLTPRLVGAIHHCYSTNDTRTHFSSVAYPRTAETLKHHHGRYAAEGGVWVGDMRQRRKMRLFILKSRNFKQR